MGPVLARFLFLFCVRGGGKVFGHLRTCLAWIREVCVGRRNRFGFPHGSGALCKLPQVASAQVMED